MKDDDDVYEAIEAARDAAAEHADNTEFTQEQSVDIWSGVAQYAQERAATIRREMRG